MSKTMVLGFYPRRYSKSYDVPYFPEPATNSIRADRTPIFATLQSFPAPELTNWIWECICGELINTLVETGPSK